MLDRWCGEATRRMLDLARIQPGQRILDVAAALTQQSTVFGVGQGLVKVAEVVFGCSVGLLVSWFMARFWLVRPPAEIEDPAGGGS